MALNKINTRCFSKLNFVLTFQMGIYFKRSLGKNENTTRNTLNTSITLFGQRTFGALFGENFSRVRSVRGRGGYSCKSVTCFSVKIWSVEGLGGP